MTSRSRVGRAAAWPCHVSGRVYRPDTGCTFFAPDQSCSANGTCVRTCHVLLDQILKFLGDVIALQGDGFLSVLVYRCDWTLTRAGKADTDVGVLALARAVHHTTHDSHRHV